MGERKTYVCSFMDESGHQMPVVVVQAKEPRNAPILVSFHGWTGGLNVERNFETWITPAQVERFPENWTILIPQDRYGFGRCGCWWLGEKGEFFILALLDRMIRHVSDAVGFNGEIYTFGISMGGFGALLHGLRWKARAICANVPQVRLFGTEFTRNNERFLKVVFGADGLKRLAEDPASDDPDTARLRRFADPVNFLDGSLPLSARPTFLLAQSRFDVTPNYAREHCFHLVDTLLKMDFNFDLRIVPEFSHREHIDVVEAISWFEEKRGAILNGVENRFREDDDPSVHYMRRTLSQFNDENYR